MFGLRCQCRATLKVAGEYIKAFFTQPSETLDAWLKVKTVPRETWPMTMTEQSRIAVMIRAQLFVVVDSFLVSFLVSPCLSGVSGGLIARRHGVLHAASGRGIR
jgi:hypothetical protein